MKRIVIKRILFFTIFSICSFSCKAKNKIDNTESNCITEKNEEVNIDILIENNEFNALEILIENGLVDYYIYKNEPLLSYLISNNLTEMAKLLINRGIDLKKIDSQLDIPIFETVIYTKNAELEKILLQNGVDLTYRDKKRGNASYFDILLGLDEDNIQKEMMDIFLSFEYVRRYLQEDEDTMFSIICRWTSMSTIYIDSIYDSNFIVPDNIPILHWAILNLDALKYFVDKGANTRKVFYGEEYFGSAVDYAYYVKSNIERRQVDGTYVDVSEIEKINAIIDFLESH